MLRLAAGKVGIERGRLSAVADEQDAFAIGDFNPCRPVGADMMKPCDATDEGDEDESTKKPAHAQT